MARESTDRLLANILSRVEELSEVLSPGQGEDNNRPSTMSTVNEEVSRVFNRGRQLNTSSEQSSRRNGASSSTATTSATTGTVPPVANVSAPPRAQRQLSSNPTSAERQRRYFPAINYNKRFLNSSTSSRRQAKKKKCPSGPFILFFWQDPM